MLKKGLKTAAVAWMCGVVALVAAEGKYAGKKVMYVNAYHAGYAWSDAVTKGVQGALKDTGADLKVVCMDTKNNPSPEFLTQAAEKVKQEIEAYKPDVVVCSDDNPVKSVIVPFYKDKDLPFVFCGVNWDCSGYGLPCKNVTGVLEVSLVPQLLKTLEPFAKGKRVGHLGKDNETDRKEGAWIIKKFNAQLTEEYVKTFEEWKAAFKAMQEKVDILILQNNAGIEGWNNEEAIKFIEENIKIPTGGVMEHMAPFVLANYGKSGEEQGDLATRMALQILDGKKPADLPVTENKLSKVVLNMKLAKKLGVVFDINLVKQAELIK